MRWWWHPPCLLRLVIVNLRSAEDVALRGVLWSARGRWLVLREVHLLKANANATPVDGEVVVDRDNVAFIQALP